MFQTQTSKFQDLNLSSHFQPSKLLVLNKEEEKKKKKEKEKRDESN